MLRYPAESTIDTDYRDDLELLLNATAGAEFLLHSQEQEVGSIELKTKLN